MAENYDPPVDELSFVLDASAQWRRVLALPAFAHLDATLAGAILEEGARFCAGVLSPINHLGDEQGCVLEEGKVRVPAAFRAAYAAFVAGGWAGMDLPAEVGGQALPTTLAVAFSEMVNGACVAFGMMGCMVRAGAHLILEHGEAEEAGRIARELLSGEAGATIVITEPQAGSDVAAIRTRAVPDGDGGGYRLTGSKIFITCADQDYTGQIYHFVLAQAAAAPGAAAASPSGAGLTLFMVPKRGPAADAASPANGVAVLGLEKKMGLKASPTCAVAFDEARGQRIGAEGRGLACMFTMMNLMRLEVAVQSVGIASAATQRALRYAHERRQGGNRALPIVQHGDVRRMLVHMQAMTGAMRALVLDVASTLDLARHAPSAAERAAASDYVEFMLPICKAWMSDSAFQVANLGVQVMGGYGYVADGGMEQYVRDSRVMAIYEGTNGIQAQDLLRRKLIKAGGRGHAVWLARMRETLAPPVAGATLASLRTALAAALARFEAISTELMQAEAVRLDLCAAWYLQWAGLLAGAWSSYRLAIAAAQGGGDDGTGADAAAGAAARLATARFYFDAILPETDALESRIRAADASLAAALAEALPAPA
ncbi:MAG: acyl-CoA dehydrogenase family protein [Proteobacteria bacterium]|nr:acyl-CoA dehydrogenase family protein [Pseudomonadota bacterium]